MNLPEQTGVQELLDEGGLTGAEMDVLIEYLSWSPSDWSHWLESEAEDEPEADCQDDGYEEMFPSHHRIRRVREIMNNHGRVL